MHLYGKSPAIRACRPVDMPLAYRVGSCYQRARRDRRLERRQNDRPRGCACQSLPRARPGPEGSEFLWNRRLLGAAAGVGFVRAGRDQVGGGTRCRCYPAAADLRPAVLAAHRPHRRGSGGHLRRPPCPSAPALRKPRGSARQRRAQVFRSRSGTPDMGSRTPLKSILTQSFRCRCG